MTRSIAIPALLWAASTAASARATLGTREASVGAGHNAVSRVPHGCKGSTTEIPRAGKASADCERPAGGVKLLAAK